MQIKKYLTILELTLTDGSVLQCCIQTNEGYLWCYNETDIAISANDVTKVKVTEQ